MTRINKCSLCEFWVNSEQNNYKWEFTPDGKRAYHIACPKRKELWQ